MSTAKLYGIPNCDTVKKATAWLQQNNIDYSFHDYKKQGIGIAKLKKWCAVKGWETIFNKRSSTWKEIMQQTGKAVTNADEAIAIMLQHNSVIKRPVIEFAGGIIAGYNEKEYLQLLK